MNNKQRETETDRDRQTETSNDRQTETNRTTQRQTNKDTQKETPRQTETARQRQTLRHKQRQTETNRTNKDKQEETEGDRWRETTIARQTETDVMRTQHAFETDVVLVEPRLERLSAVSPQHCRNASQSAGAGKKQSAVTCLYGFSAMSRVSRRGPPDPRLRRVANTFHAISELRTESAEPESMRARIDRIGRVMDSLNGGQIREGREHAHGPDFVRRSNGLIKYMDRCREVKSLKKGQRPAPHIQARVEKLNNSHNLSKAEQIKSLESKPTKIKGKGMYKMYVPRAIQRCAWGEPWAPPVARRKRRSRRYRHTNKSASLVSRRAVAYLYGNRSHSHIGLVRKATARMCVQISKDNMTCRLKGSNEVLELTADETEHPLRLECRNEIASLLMSQVKVSTFHDDAPPVSREYPLPTAVLKSTSADCFFPALLKRLAIYGSLEDFAAVNRRLNIVLGTDSAPSCSRGFRCLSQLVKNKQLRNVSSIHAPCQCHQQVIIITDLLKMNKLINGVFCTLLQLHRHRSMSMFRSVFRSKMSRGLVIDVDGSSSITDAGIEFTHALLALLEPGEEGIHLREEYAGNRNVDAHRQHNPWELFRELVPDWLAGAHAHTHTHTESFP